MQGTGAEGAISGPDMRSQQSREWFRRSKLHFALYLVSMAAVVSAQASISKPGVRLQDLLKHRADVSSQQRLALVDVVALTVAVNILRFDILSGPKRLLFIV
jgi:hypothetical protein